ncbi:MAG: DegV family protein [Eggerthellaceae bacterium]|nr:DegV family protein [Eggerthellaceae bacterium]
MQYSIVVDSSSDLVSADQLHLEGSDIGFGVAPLTIQAGGREWPDVAETDVAEMADFLAKYHGKSGTACPSTGEWIKAFNDAREVFGIAITSHLSGSYNSALVAKEQYEADNPGARVHIVDSLSTGPQMWLMAEKLKELMEQKLPFEAIRDEIEAYRDRTELIFSLESLNNLANNGRVNPAVAKIATVLGIRIVGLAENGELDPRNKVRGEKKALATIIKEMGRKNFNGGKVRISHVLNEPAALKLRDMIADAFPTAQIALNPARALCSFYAERGGLLIGFETK